MSLKELRTEAGLSQKELGERLAKKVPRVGSPEYFQPRISAYESGRNKMPLDVALAVVSILNAALRKAGSRRIAKVEDLASKKPRA